MLTNQFLIDLQQKYIETFCTYNQDKTVETRQWDFPTKVGKVETMKVLFSGWGSRPFLQIHWHRS